jgi:hypothetical protein
MSTRSWLRARHRRAGNCWTKGASPTVERLEDRMLLSSGISGGDRIEASLTSLGGRAAHQASATESVPLVTMIIDLGASSAKGGGLSSGPGYPQPPRTGPVLQGDILTPVSPSAVPVALPGSTVAVVPALLSGAVQSNQVVAASSSAGTIAALPMSSAVAPSTTTVSTSVIVGNGAQTAALPSVVAAQGTQAPVAVNQPTAASTAQGSDKVLLIFLGKSTTSAQAGYLEQSPDPVHNATSSNLMVQAPTDHGTAMMTWSDRGAVRPLALDRSAVSSLPERSDSKTVPGDLVQAGTVSTDAGALATENPNAQPLATNLSELQTTAVALGTTDVAPALPPGADSFRSANWLRSLIVGLCASGAYLAFRRDRRSVASARPDQRPALRPLNG